MQDQLSRDFYYVFKSKPMDVARFLQRPNLPVLLLTVCHSPKACRLEPPNLSLNFISTFKDTNDVKSGI